MEASGSLTDYRHATAQSSHFSGTIPNAQASRTVAAGFPAAVPGLLAPGLYFFHIACGSALAGDDKMMAETKAADLRLDGLVARMNAATGQPKIDATAAVVSEMVAQRKTMHDGMMKMLPGMAGRRKNSRGESIESYI